MQTKSQCCHADIVQHHSTEYPLGGYYGLATVVQACAGCGEEHPDTVDVCDCCGEPGDLIETPLGDWCLKCAMVYSEDLIERDGTPVAV